MGTFSIWHWLVVLLILGIPGMIVYAAVKGVRAEQGRMSPGFKGWLLILAIVNWITALRVMAEFGKTVSELSGETAQRFPLLFQIDLAINFTGFLLTAWVVFLMMRRSASFPRMFMLLAVWAVIAMPLSLGAALLALQNVYGITVGVADMLNDAASDMGQWLGGVISAAL